MGNDVAGVTASRPVKPRLRAFLVAILDREPAPDVGWKPPGDAWIERHEEALRQALVDIQAALRPANEMFIRQQLAVLATYKGSRAGVAAEWKLRRREYVRLLGHYPADIWQDALDEWTLTSKWFPDISKVNELMQPRLQERWRQAKRLQAMLATKGEHKPKVCEYWRDKEPELRQEIEDRDYKAWLSQATPLSDDGATLILAVPNKFIGLTIRDKFGSDLSRILQREVKFIVTSWARSAARDRARRAEDSSGAYG